MEVRADHVRPSADAPGVGCSRAGTRAAACALEKGFQGGVAQGGIYGPARVVCKCANG